MKWKILFNLPIIFLILTSILILEQPKITYSEEYTKYQKSILKFNDWAENYNVILTGINKSSEHLLKYTFNQNSDEVSINSVPDILVAAEIFYTIPDSVVKSMDGKTIFFSTENGRGLALVSYSNPIENMNEGIIIEQQITPYHVLHELGHLVDLNDSQISNKEKINKAKNEIFSINNTLNTNNGKFPKGYLSYYSLTSEEENFAEHFAFYVFSAEKFREMAETDSLLEKKYNFFKDYVFDSLEY